MRFKQIASPIKGSQWRYFCHYDWK